MRRFILGTFFAASFGLPALSFAAPTTGRNTTEPIGQPQPVQFERMRPHDQPANGSDTSSLGGGMAGGNEPGHVDSPGATKIDPSSRGPINDVQPGRGTTDTRQNQNPPPAR